MAACLLRSIAFVAFVFSVLWEIEAQKEWIPTNNFEDAGNWNLKRVPCSRDRAVIPPDATLALFVEESVTFSELMLPLNGEVILPANVEINVGPKNSDRCAGQDNVFLADRIYSWYDPANWKTDVNSDGHLSRDASNNPVPHSEKVPCPFDSIVFPTNAAFSVYVQDLDTSVATFKINGKNLDTDGLRNFLASDSGRLQFKVDRSLSMTRRKCSQAGGCSCYNDRPDILNVICSHVTKNGCPIPSCVDPVVPYGYCCAICGSTVTVAIDQYFEFDKLKQFYVSYLRQPRFQSVSGYMFRTYLGQVQAVFYDDSKMHRSKGLVEEIEKSTFGDDYQKARLNILSYEIKTTTDWSRSPSPFSSVDGLSTGSWVALILGIISLAVLGLLYIVQRTHYVPFNFSFGRFYNEDGDLEVGVEMTHSKASTSAEQDACKGFDNPYYSAPADESSERREDPVVGKSYETDHTRQNPCYMAFEGVEDVPETTAPSE